MKLLPFAVIYGGQLAPNVVLSSTKTIVSGTVAQLNAAITELNTNFANYGYGASPGFPAIPAIPTPGSTAPNGIAYFQSQPPGGISSGPSSSYLLIDAFTSNGYTDPQGQLDTLTADSTLVMLQAAIASLSGAAAIAIGTQPTNQSIAHNAAGAIALVATGAGLTVNWYMNLSGASGFTLLTAANVGVNTIGGAVFSTYNTQSLTITQPPLATYNGAKFYAIVSSVSGGQDLKSTTVTLTVT
jgi:hypothetical protein